MPNFIKILLNEIIRIIHVCFPFNIRPAAHYGNLFNTENNMRGINDYG